MSVTVATTFVIFGTFVMITSVLSYFLLCKLIEKIINVLIEKFKR